MSERDIEKMLAAKEALGHGSAYLGPPADRASVAPDDVTLDRLEDWLRRAGTDSRIEAAAAIRSLRAQVAERDKFRDDWYKRFTHEQLSAVIARAETAEAALAKERAHARMIYAERTGQVWYWQDDGKDYPESLACPVVVKPEVVRRWLAAEAALRACEAEREAMRKDAERYRLLCQSPDANINIAAGDGGWLNGVFGERLDRLCDAALAQPREPVIDPALVQPLHPDGNRD